MPALAPGIGGPDAVTSLRALADANPAALDAEIEAGYRRALGNAVNSAGHQESK